MKRRREPDVYTDEYSAWRMHVAIFLGQGPLRINDIVNIVLEYSAEFEGRRMCENKFP